MSIARNYDRELIALTAQQSRPSKERPYELAPFNRSPEHDQEIREQTELAILEYRQLLQKTTTFSLIQLSTLDKAKKKEQRLITDFNNIASMISYSIKTALSPNEAILFWQAEAFKAHANNDLSLFMAISNAFLSADLSREMQYATSPEAKENATKLEGIRKDFIADNFKKYGEINFSKSGQIYVPQELGFLEFLPENKYDAAVTMNVLRKMEKRVNPNKKFPLSKLYEDNPQFLSELNDPNITIKDLMQRGVNRLVAAYMAVVKENYPDKYATFIKEHKLEKADKAIREIYILSNINDELNKVTIGLQSAREKIESKHAKLTKKNPEVAEIVSSAVRGIGDANKSPEEKIIAIENAIGRLSAIKHKRSKTVPEVIKQLTQLKEGLESAKNLEARREKYRTKPEVVPPAPDPSQVQVGAPTQLGNTGEPPAPDQPRRDGLEVKDGDVQEVDELDEVAPNQFGNVGDGQEEDDADEDLEVPAPQRLNREDAKVKSAVQGNPPRPDTLDSTASATVSRGPVQLPPDDLSPPFVVEHGDLKAQEEEGLAPPVSGPAQVAPPVVGSGQIENEDLKGLGQGQQEEPAPPRPAQLPPDDLPPTLAAAAVSSQLGNVAPHVEAKDPVVDSTRVNPQATSTATASAQGNPPLDEAKQIRQNKRDAFEDIRAEIKRLKSLKDDQTISPASRSINKYRLGALESIINRQDILRDPAMSIHLQQLIDNKTLRAEHKKPKGSQEQPDAGVVGLLRALKSAVDANIELEDKKKASPETPVVGTAQRAATREDVKDPTVQAPPLAPPLPPSPAQLHQTQLEKRKAEALELLESKLKTEQQGPYAVSVMEKSLRGAIELGISIRGVSMIMNYMNKTPAERRQFEQRIDAIREHIPDEEKQKFNDAYIDFNVFELEGIVKHAEEIKQAEMQQGNADELQEVEDLTQDPVALGEELAAMMASVTQGNNPPSTDDGLQAALDQFDQDIEANQELEGILSQFSTDQLDIQDEELDADEALDLDDNEFDSTLTATGQVTNIADTTDPSLGDSKDLDDQDQDEEVKFDGRKNLESLHDDKETIAKMQQISDFMKALPSYSKIVHAVGADNLDNVEKLARAGLAKRGDIKAWKRHSTKDNGGQHPAAEQAHLFAQLFHKNAQGLISPEDFKKNLLEIIANLKAIKKTGHPLTNMHHLRITTSEQTAPTHDTQTPSATRKSQ